MKTVKKFSPIGMFAILILLTNGCAKDNAKTSKMAISLSTITSSTLNKISLKGSLSGLNLFTLSSVKVCIADLIIEENSGNDLMQQGDHNDNGGGIGKNSIEGPDTENADVHLPGPYVLDVINGKVTIDQAYVYPGTFKKVDFTFLINNTSSLNGNSIIVLGNYQKVDGMVLPLILKSDINKQIQLPLANGGIIVAANSTVTLSIVLDISKWINNLDLSSAVYNNNEILIDKTNNQELLRLFEANLSSDIVEEN